jgi:hypothetical protein
MGKKCSTHGGNENTYRVLVGKPEGKRTLGKHRHRLEDNTEIDIREVG